MQLCKRCKSHLPSISGFYRSPSNKSGFDTSCKSCREDVKFQWKCTPHGFFTRLISTAKASQNRRYEKKGLKAPAFLLTKEYLHTLYDKQNGLGFYSHIPLALRPLSHWQTSLERLNPNQDYVHDNVVLDACEFNNTCQWSTKKVIAIPSLIASSSNATLQDLNYARIQPRRKKSKKTLTQNKKLYCYDCHEWKDTDVFYKRNSHICRSCFAQYDPTLRGFMNILRTRAKHNCKYKMSSDDDTRNEFTLTLDDSFDLLEQQMFRCAYSGIPMRFKSNSDWKCSIERKDNMKGYTKDNCAFICWEFNSSDRTLLAGNPLHVQGSSQWNKEKFEYFYRIRFGEAFPSIYDGC
eukprot:314854_1